ncbi:ATP-binding cassette domain-containing protein [Pedobacter nutrimenti]|uniref:ATP-binding cassette domain-containing protein n=1 Tax=Pedobacter nutrimenti TaxID=1241337 RepID=UPI00292EF8BE|nr:ATP-binding cassette domain-containing protein [Pedobacter nutrimenti]
MSVEVESLSKHYGSQIAVNAISFKAVPGRVMGFLGPNGAGKSTTMKMLTGYLQPSSGKVHVGGFDVLTQGLEVKRIMGYLPENTPLYTDMYVKEFLSFAGQTYQLSNLNRIVAEVIERVGLGPEQHKKIGQLSKGYRQRVGLAQAIVHDPSVLILDEPTSGLDPNQLAGIRKLIKELGGDKTVILSTHIMQEAEAVCDDVVIINKGNIVANSSLADLKKDQDSEVLEDIFRKLTL